MQFEHHLRVEPAGDKDTVFPIGARDRFTRRGRHASVRRGSTLCRSASGGLDRANREGGLSPVPLCIQAALGRGDLPCATAIVSSTRIAT
ncbi:hypothetical protein SCE1572_31555 [Sorangium cellulosum So0157-2]|uniref:Uncharacterized protein n=1 Tax=Sorangium cellulosum So0157-2 TaxID=1254432 RepID=S4XZG5_SORCE|nr:hypothetical protein SCE1572_31555 [Sorangium cellulosum So0157-2]